MGDPAFQLSVGALLALGTIAVGYGMLRSTVHQIRDDLQSLERDCVYRDKQIRSIELWIERRKGERDAKYRQSFGSDTGTHTPSDSDSGSSH